MIGRFLTSLAAPAALVATFVLAGVPATAQSGNPFAPVVLVNGAAVTNFELDQRIRMLQLFRTPGDLRQQALQALIDDRLRLGAAADMEIVVTEDAVTAGMAEFAQRTNMDTEAFVSNLASAGVSAESFRDFVKAGIAWREVVQKRFGPRIQITEADAREALQLVNQPGKAEAVMAEIILPARDADEAAQSEALAREIQATVSSTGAFAAAAQQYSAAPTAANGGRIDRPIPLDELPPPIRTQVLTMAPGSVTDPLIAPNAIAVFQLVALHDLGKPESPADVQVEYASYLLPGGRSEATLAAAAKIMSRVDTCTDLYTVNKGQDPNRLTIQTQTVAQLPADVAMQLAKLDAGEISTDLTRGDNLVMLMLCARNPVREEQPDLRNVQTMLINRRLGGFGDVYLSQLRSDALIRYP